MTKQQKQTFISKLRQFMPEKTIRQVTCALDKSLEKPVDQNDCIVNMNVDANKAFSAPSAMKSSRFRMTDALTGQDTYDRQD